MRIVRSLPELKVDRVPTTVSAICTVIPDSGWTTRVAAVCLAASAIACGCPGSAGADEFEPLCCEGDRDKMGFFGPRCWTPVVNHPGCHFHGLLSLTDNTAPVS